MDTHLKPHAIQLKQLTQTQTHPLHDFNAYSDPLRKMKITIFHNNEHTNIIILEPDITPEKCRENLKHIHTTINSQYFSSKKEKEAKLLTLHPMTFIHQNKHYNVICIENWHKLKPTNNHSYKVTYIY